MHVPSGCHIVQICPKNSNACMRLMRNPRKCMFLVEGQHTFAYIFLCHFVCISMPTSIGFQRLSCWISIYAHNYQFLRSRFMVLRSNMEKCPLMNHMPDFYAVYHIVKIPTSCSLISINIYHKLVPTSLNAWLLE
jgi:hypothetical protein